MSPVLHEGLGLALWVLWLAVAVDLDTVHRRLPNAWMLAGALLALVLAVLPGGIGLQAALQGGLAALLVFLPGYVLHRLGAGDVKLMAVCGLLAGTPAVWGLCLAVMLAGGVQALLWLAWSAWQAWRASAPGLAAAANPGLDAAAPAAAATAVDLANPRIPAEITATPATPATPSAACAPQVLAPAPARPLPYAWAVAGGVLLHAFTGPWTGA